MCFKKKKRLQKGTRLIFWDQTYGTLVTPFRSLNLWSQLQDQPVYQATAKGDEVTDFVNFFFQKNQKEKLKEKKQTKRETKKK